MTGRSSYSGSTRISTLVSELSLTGVDALTKKDLGHMAKDVTPARRGDRE
jgi:hypothetical protein